MTASDADTDLDRVRAAAAGELERFLDALTSGVEVAPDPVATGLATLDDHLGGGIPRGGVTLLAGHTGAGTSMLALQIAAHAAIQLQRRVIFQADDASSVEVRRRVVATWSKVPVGHLRSGALGELDAARLEAQRERLVRAPLILSRGACDRRFSTHVENARGYAADLGLDMVVIDRSPQNAADVENLQELARDAQVAVLVTAKTELGAAVMRRPDLVDVVAAESVVDAVDVVLGLHPDVFDRRSTRPGEADVEVLKNRYGPPGRLAQLLFQGHFARFVDP